MFGNSTGERLHKQRAGIFTVQIWTQAARPCELQFSPIERGARSEVRPHLVAIVGVRFRTYRADILGASILRLWAKWRQRTHTTGRKKVNPL